MTTMATQKIESIICHVCDQIVLSDSIFCDLCFTWLHLKCSGLNKKSFRHLSMDENAKWFCKLCLKGCLPFMSETNFYVTSSTFNSSLPPHAPIDNTCFACNKEIKDCCNNSILCNVSRHRLHLKCANLNKTKLTYINTKHWNCKSCNPFPFNDIDSTDLKRLSNFNSLLTTSSNTCLIKTTHSFDCLKDLPMLQIENPLPQDDNSISNEETNLSLDFKYYNLQEFLSLRSKLNRQQSVSAFHTNIRSYKKNFASLTALLNELDFSFDFVGLTETWDDTTKNTSFLPETLSGYQPFESTPGTSQNSGCGLYVKEGIHFSKRDDLSCCYYDNKCEFQTMFVEIHNTKSRNLLVGVVYRHPKGGENSDTDPFLSNIKKIMTTASKENKEMIIMGDFNLNLLNIDTKEYTANFLQSMLSFSFQPHILQPTRFTTKDKYSLIDNIFYNTLDHNCISGNLIPHITDHLPNFMIINKSAWTQSKRPKLFKRDYSSFVKEDFIQDIENLHLNRVLCTKTDTNSMYEFFHDELNKTFDHHAPMKQVTKKQAKQLKKPWITDHILKLIGEKNMLYGHFIQTGCKETLRYYRTIRNDINHKIRKSKIHYYKGYFASCTNNIKKFWKGINTFLSSKKKESEAPSLLHNNAGKSHTEPLDIANKFNSYFVNVAPNLLKKMPKQSSKSFSDYLGQNSNHSFLTAPVTNQEILDLISNLDGKKTTDIYNFPIQLIKDTKDALAAPLSQWKSNTSP